MAGLAFLAPAASTPLARAPQGVAPASGAAPRGSAAAGAGAAAFGAAFAAACRGERKVRAFRVLRLAADQVPPAPASSVIIKRDADAVASAVCAEVVKAAKEAVAARGAFALAIPGGSILKMLASGSSELQDVEWSKGVLAYVNHKCVANDDPAATHQKANELFLSGWSGLKVITMGGSADGEAEAQRYEAELRALPETTLPRSQDGMPIFDLCLIGVGDDGHFGSLYPGRKEIADESGRWVLPVDMKSPPSITLSPGVMLASKSMVASAGVSEKYPMGKSEAMQRAIEGAEGYNAFPAQRLRQNARWLLDEAAASALGLRLRCVWPIGPCAADTSCFRPPSAIDLLCGLQREASALN
ncbi:unnamed protein product [Effrenium voratum]|nr:unnamed protein product [Effrenium voratum]